jgi:predicted amidohydrolase
MPKSARISTISAQPCRVDSGQGLQSVVDQEIRHLASEIGQVLPDSPDLIVLPEACDRPFEWPAEKRADYYRARGGQALEFLKSTAVDNNCYIAYSAVREEQDGTWRNSTRIIDRRGAVAGTYNKNHLVIEENTRGGMLYGKDAPLIDCDFDRVACVICFDLNFDELRLAYAAQKPDLIVFCSNYHGGLMQNYWAYSCHAHFVGAIGAWGCPGSIINPLGELIAESTNYYDFVTADVNLVCCVAHLDYTWDGLAAARKKYGPSISVSDPGRLGSVLLSSRVEGMSARSIASEFNIELLDDYMARCLAHRHSPGNMEI